MGGLGGSRPPGVQSQSSMDTTETVSSATSSPDSSSPEYSDNLRPDDHTVRPGGSHYQQVGVWAGWGRDRGGAAGRVTQLGCGRGGSHYQQVWAGLGGAVCGESRTNNVSQLTQRTGH